MSEPLRASALLALGPDADPRAHEVLAQATIEVERDVARWEASEGTMRAHHVALGLDAATLARVTHAPAVIDALHAALASAIASPRETLGELSFFWSPRVRVSTAYRGVDPTCIGSEVSLGDALVAYLRAAGDEAAALVASRAEVKVHARRGKTVAVVHGPAEAASHAAALAASVRALLTGPRRGDRDRLDVRVEV